MAVTNNIGKLTDSPIGFIQMGNIADRPSAGELNNVYISTDEGNKWKIYWYNGSSWQQFKGVSAN